MRNQNPKRTDIDSIDILNVFMNGKSIIIMSILVTVVAAFLVTIFFIEPRYEASTKILLREEKLNAKDNFPSYETGGQFANSQAQIISSKPIIKKALKRIDFSKSAFSDLSKEELKVKRLQEAVNVRLIENTNVLKLKVEYSNPMFASALANALSQSYIENRAKLKSENIERSIASLEREIEFAKEDFIEVENKLSEIAGKEKLIMLSGSEIILNLKKYADFDIRLASANADLETIETELKLIKQQAENRGTSNRNFKFLSDNTALNELKSQIRLAELKLDELMSEFSVNHPEVVAVTAAINKLEAYFISERESIIKAEIKHLQMKKMALLNKRNSLLKVHKQQADRMNEVLQNQPKLAQLNRDIKMKRAIYSDLLGKLQDLKVLKQRTGMSPDAEIIEFADVPEDPTKPNLMVNLLLAALLGLTVGFALALIYSVSSSDKLKPEQDFGQDIERRSSQRIKASNSVTYTVVGENTEIVSQAKDVSRSGMKIISTEKLEPDNILEFAIQRDKMKPIAGNGVVVWTSPVSSAKGDTKYASGIKFYDLELDITKKPL